MNFIKHICGQHWKHYLIKDTLSYVELNLKKLFFQRQCSQSLYDAQSYSQSTLNIDLK